LCYVSASFGEWQSLANTVQWASLQYPAWNLLISGGVFASSKLGQLWGKRFYPLDQG